MPDVDIPCVQCREIFIFSEKDQETFYQRNMMTPQRCPKCRSKKAAVRDDAPEGASSRAPPAAVIWTSPRDHEKPASPSVRLASRAGSLADIALAVANPRSPSASAIQVVTDCVEVAL